MYPLYENAFRAHRGQSLKANHEESARLYAEFSKVAKYQEYAWNQGMYSDEETIGTVSGKNRMICFPCKSSPYYSTYIRKSGLLTTPQIPS